MYLNKQLRAMKHSSQSSSNSSSTSSNDTVAELESKLQKTTTLEAKLSTTLSSSSAQATSSTNSTRISGLSRDAIQQQASKIRIELCEKYSDLLLTNPSFAYRKDIPNKLWRSCFYGRINELRNRISKEKSRHKKVVERYNSLDQYKRRSVVGGNDNANNQVVLEQEKRVKASQNVLNVFLKEAVVLYEYLVDQLHGMLIECSDNENDSIQEEGQNDDDDFEERFKSQSQNTMDTAAMASNNNNHKNGKQQQQQTSQRKKENPKFIFLVPTLFRIYIHLGDLHRYSSSYNAAEKVYLKASCLAPGKGNPYNQLAVCAQINDSTNNNAIASNNSSNSNAKKSGSHPLPAVALYWYCRSLLASHDAFVTSRSNLERLFQSNKKWIEESNVKTFADVAKNKNDNNEDNTINSGENKEKVRTAKTIAKRKFLSHFVDFHGSLLSLMKSAQKVGESGAGVSGSDEKGGKEDIDRLISQMDNLIAEFGSILESSAFGDAFLIKMVCINVFSLWNSFEYQKQAIGEENEQSFLKSTAIALIFTLRFGSQLCSDLEKVLEKVIAKQQRQGKTFGSIRLIGPVFLLYEFISNECNLNGMMDKLTNVTPTLAEKFDCSVQEFWRGSATVANIVHGHEPLLKLIQSEGNGGINDLPDDFQSLFRGFTPFLSLDDAHNATEKNCLNESKEIKKVYLTPAEAVDTLELYQSQTQQSQSSQRSKKSASQSYNNNDCRTPEKIESEVKIKLKRFMKFISKHLESGDLIKSLDGLIHTSHDYAENINAGDDANTDYDDIDMDVDEENLDNDSLTGTQDHSEEKDQDMLVYTEAELGKPALLVPGAFFYGEDNKEEKEEDTDLTLKETSYAPDAPMMNAYEEKNKPLPNLLNPTLLLEKTNETLEPKIEESKLLSVVSKKQPSNAADFSLLPQVAAAQSQTATQPVPQPKSSVPPPPGFHPMQKSPDPMALPSASPSLQALPQVSRNLLPPPGAIGFSPNIALPRTANPFVTSNQYSADSSMVFNALPNHGESSSNLFPRPNPQSFSPFFKQNAVGAAAYTQNVDEMNDDLDRFGLRSLGIFTDSQNDTVPNLSVDSLFQSPVSTENKATKNPFA